MLFSLDYFFWVDSFASISSLVHFFLAFSFSLFALPLLYFCVLLLLNYLLFSPNPTLSLLAKYGTTFIFFSCDFFLLCVRLLFSFMKSLDHFEEKNLFSLTFAASSFLFNFWFFKYKYTYFRNFPSSYLFLHALFRLPEKNMNENKSLFKTFSSLARCCGRWRFFRALFMLLLVLRLLVVLLDVVFLLPLIWRRWRRRRPTRRRPRRCSSYICRRAVSVCLSVCSSVCTAARTVLHENAAASQPRLGEISSMCLVLLHRTYTGLNQPWWIFSFTSNATVTSHIAPNPQKLNLVRIARTLEPYTSGVVSHRTRTQ